MNLFTPPATLLGSDEPSLGVSMKPRAAGAIFLLSLILQACGARVPPDKADYVGEWRAPGMYLLLTQDGSVQYNRLRGAAETSIRGPLQKFKGNDFSVGLLFLSTTFVVSRPPYQDGGKWRMVVDGVELTKSGQPGASSTERLIAEREERRRTAFELHHADKFSDAITIYDQLLIDTPKDAELYFWRGVAHSRLGHSDIALQDFRRVIDLQPTNLEAYRNADEILAPQARWDEILAMWNRYLDRVPADPEAYFERGGTNFHKGNLAAAQADAAEACRLGKSEACTLAERLRSKL